MLMQFARTSDQLIARGSLSWVVGSRLPLCGLAIESIETETDKLLDRRKAG